MADKSDPEKVAAELIEFQRRMGVIEADAANTRVDIRSLADRVAAMEKKDA